VPGLKTIVPIAAISSWYDYYRANGLVVAPGGYQGEDADVLARAVLTRRQPEKCAAVMKRIERDEDRVTGDYSKFWRDRDYLPGARNVRSSVFITHGLGDWNVKTTHFAQWWDALGKAGVKRRLWLHPGGHGQPASDAWRNAVHRWIDHYLYGIRNGADREPVATVERGIGVVDTARSWPDPRTRDVALDLAPGRLSTWGRSNARESFVDNGATRTADDLVKRPQTADPNRLAYRTPPLTRDARLSGTPRIELRASVDNRTAANLTALLVDYSPDGTLKIVSRGWTDVKNRGSSQSPKPVEPGRFYSFRWTQAPKDYIFAEDHRIGLVVISTDHHYTLRPKAGTVLSVRPGESRFVLPIVGGRLRF
jgi:X-Pro dipeptidyl-peptidase